MTAEPTLGMGSAQHWGCELNGIVFTRDESEFSLSIANLPITAGLNGTNKLPLMGKTGSGKSTLLNLMSAMDLPKEGTIKWTFPDSAEPIEWGASGLTSEKASLLRSKYFGFAFQDSTLIPHLNVLDNLCYPLYLQGKLKADARFVAEIKLKSVLIEKETVADLSQRYPSQLSGGQRQRAALAQAMVHDPKVLFADEPTGSLDSETRRQVMNVLHNWVDEAPDKRCMIWVTHHDSDPADAGVSQRLIVEGGICKWDTAFMCSGSITQ